MKEKGRGGKSWKVLVGKGMQQFQIMTTRLVPSIGTIRDITDLAKAMPSRPVYIGQ